MKLKSKDSYFFFYKSKTMLIIYPNKNDKTEIPFMDIEDYEDDKEYIKDYSEQMDVLRSSFPEIYNLYCNGKIVINEMYHFKTKDGK